MFRSNQPPHTPPDHAGLARSAYSKVDGCGHPKVDGCGRRADIETGRSLGLGPPPICPRSISTRHTIYLDRYLVQNESKMKLSQTQGDEARAGYGQLADVALDLARETVDWSEGVLVHILPG